MHKYLWPWFTIHANRKLKSCKTKFMKYKLVTCWSFYFNLPGDNFSHVVAKTICTNARISSLLCAYPHVSVTDHTDFTFCSLMISNKMRCFGKGGGDPISELSVTQMSCKQSGFLATLDFWDTHLDPDSSLHITGCSLLDLQCLNSFWTV